MSFTKRLRYWLLLLPLLGLLAMTYWLDQQTQSEPSQLPQLESHRIDALMENFSATQMDAQGLPHFLVSAKQLHHYPDDDSTTLQEPVVNILSSGSMALHSSAKQGRISSKGNDIFLSDGVEMRRDSPIHRDQFSLNTEAMHVMPNQNLIVTDLPVTFTDTNTTLHATGMEVNYQLRTMKLLTHVQAVYAPAKK
jgi:lipopolysaccharide export system protein LptC